MSLPDETAGQEGEEQNAGLEETEIEEVVEDE